MPVRVHIVAIGTPSSTLWFFWNNIRLIGVQLLTQDTYTYPGKLISNFILEEDVLCNIDLNISGIIIMMMIFFFIVCSDKIDILPLQLQSLLFGVCNEENKMTKPIWPSIKLIKKMNSKNKPSTYARKRYLRRNVGKNFKNNFL